MCTPTPSQEHALLLCRLGLRGLVSLKSQVSLTLKVHTGGAVPAEDPRRGRALPRWDWKLMVKTEGMVFSFVFNVQFVVGFAVVFLAWLSLV